MEKETEILADSINATVLLNRIIENKNNNYKPQLDTEIIKWFQTGLANTHSFFIKADSNLFKTYLEKYCDGKSTEEVTIGIETFYKCDENGKHYNSEVGAEHVFVKLWLLKN